MSDLSSARFTRWVGVPILSSSRAIVVASLAMVAITSVTMSSRCSCESRPTMPRSIMQTVPSSS